MGFAFLYKNSGVISWASKLQTSVSKSTAELEAKALSLACNECFFFMNLLQELQVGVNNFKTFFDNQTCNSLVKNHVNEGVVEQFAIQLHFVRDIIEKKQLDLNHIGTESMVADILAKKWGKTKCQRFEDQMFAIEWGFQQCNNL